MHGLIQQVRSMYAFERGQDVGLFHPRLEPHKAVDGQGQGGIEMQLLRHIANAQPRQAFQRAFRRGNQAQHHTNQR
ncbi:hypothetical protein D3C75_1104200 [compost metagenome]